MTHYEETIEKDKQKLKKRILKLDAKKKELEALYAEDELFLKRLREPERHGRSLMRGRHNG
jgi:hypothetical protein